jgi:hypothetical protein
MLHSTRAKHFRSRLKLDMYFETNRGDVFRH